MSVTRRVFNSNNFATSAALAEVRALCVILVVFVRAYAKGAGTGVLVPQWLHDSSQLIIL